MTENLISKLLVVPYYFMGLNLLVGIIFLKRQTKTQRLLFILIIITVIVELLSTMLWYASKNNMALFHLYTVVEFVILSLFYKKYLTLFSISRWFNLIIGLFIGFAVLNAIFFQHLSEFNSNTLTVSSALLIIFSIMYFNQLLRESKYTELERNPMFWVNIGVLIYFSSSIVLFHISNKLIPETLQVRGIAWGIHAIFNVFHYLAYTIALWVRPTP